MSFVKDSAVTGAQVAAVTGLNAPGIAGQSGHLSRDRNSLSHTTERMTRPGLETPVGNPVRIKILCRLMQESARVTELVEATGERRSTISQQLKYLSRELAAVCKGAT